MKKILLIIIFLKKSYFLKITTKKRLKEKNCIYKLKIEMPKINTNDLRKKKKFIII